MSKLSNLKRGLEGLDARTVPAKRELSTPAKNTTTPKPPSRIGTRNIAANLSPAFKSSLRAIQVKHDRPVQHLIAEALNLLFEKYNVPTVSE